jgi:cholesterol transport system auxiliary component
MFTGARLLFVMGFALLAGCAGPRSTPVPERFDLGAAAATASDAAKTGAPVWLAGVHAPSSLDGTAMLYRLEYSSAVQSRAFAQARWSMPVPELLEQRLRQRLSAKRAVLNAADGVQSRQNGVVLRVDLEDFSQAFSAADKASAQVRVRATLSAWRGGVEQLLDQRSFQAQQACATADAPGGVLALSGATDRVLADLERWLDATAVR